jgi:glutamate:GABA antiporter
VALFPGALEGILSLAYDFTGTWGVTRGRFEALTLGTVAVIVVLTGAGLAAGALERRRAAMPAGEVSIGSVEA